MKMRIDIQPAMESEVVCFFWKRDAETFSLLSLETRNQLAASIAFPLRLLRDIDAWYGRMCPGDTGKELWLLKQVYQKGKGTIDYDVLGLDGHKWRITESMELRTGENGRAEIHGKWICKK